MCVILGSNSLALKPILQSSPAGETEGMFVQRWGHSDSFAFKITTRFLSGWPVGELKNVPAEFIP